MTYQPMHGQQAQIIETASATTSPDNANSGSRAYLIVAASLVALIVAFMVLSGCTAMTFKSLYYLVEDDIPTVYNYDYQTQDLGPEGMQDPLTDLYGDPLDQDGQA